MRSLLLPLLIATFFWTGCGRPPTPRTPPTDPAPELVAPPITMPDVAIPPAVASELPEDAINAVQTLARAGAFGGARIGYAGVPTAEVVALRLLMNHPRGSEALDIVIEQGSLAAQLMALSGLYYVDHARFAERLEGYRGRSEIVNVRPDGCLQHYQAVTVGELVESKKSDAIRLTGPGDSIEAWSRRSGVRTPPHTVTFDIVGGGYPYAFKVVD